MNRPRLESPILQEGEAMTQGRVRDVANGRAAYFTTHSPAKDGVNEDSLAVMPLNGAGVCLMIADGMGGYPGGDQASALAVQRIVGCVEEAVARKDEPRIGIMNGFEEANKAVLELEAGAGATAAVVEVSGRTARTYHAGDCEVLIAGQRGKVKYQTVAHSPVAYGVEAGFIEPEDAIHHEERHVVTNHVGSPEMRIDVGPMIELAPRDTLVMGSDGLFDNLQVEEIVDLVRAGPLDKVCDVLLRSTHERMNRPKEGEASKQDDLSFILFRPSV